MRVAILPTGRTEWHGLVGALERLFQGHEFYPLPTAMEVDSDRYKFPYDGFTSGPLNARHVQEPPESAFLLVERAAQEAVGDRRQRPADLVVVLDDLELGNEADLATQVFRAAVTQHLDGLRARANIRDLEMTAAALRKRVSFHLVVPMIEAWVFADSSALAIAGVPDTAVVEFGATQDPEEFATTDAAFLAASVASCPCWNQLPPGKKKNLRPKWLGSVPRERHPKAYLQWLCIDGNARTCTTYHESGSGKDALRGLDWDTVFRRPSPQLRFLAALVADLADGLGQPPSTDVSTRLLAPQTANPPVCRVLRNL